jgi:hypothetical protein
VLFAPLIAVMCDPKRCALFRSCCITLRVSDFLSKYSGIEFWIKALRAFGNADNGYFTSQPNSSILLTPMIIVLSTIDDD